MQLEYLPDGSEACPLIRLFDFTPDEIRQLQAHVADLETGADRVSIHHLTGVTAPDGCGLVLIVGPKDRGVIAKGARQFECVLDRDGWGQVAELIQPLVDGAAGFQWLCEMGDANWLISHDGSW